MIKAPNINEHFLVIRGYAVKSLARPGRKQATATKVGIFCQNGENFLRRLALQKKKHDDSSRLDVIEIARVA
jgi:hypothetical protein